jgi:glycosyltransferase involved in cell wall biosynthesis
MPLYNKRAYVTRAIKSVQKQTFTNWELIIINDGSTDGSFDEIPRDDYRIRLFHQENKGPSAARNKGIKSASGDLITFLDADDYYHPEKLEKEMTVLWQEQRAEWMISAFEYESGDEVITRYIKDFEGKELKGEPMVIDNALKQLAMAGWHIDGLCIKKRLLDKTGGFNEAMRCYEIAELLVRCALEQPKVFIYPQPLYRVVDLPDSAFKLFPQKIEGKRQQGESLYRLSKLYPEYLNKLVEKSRKALLSYVAMLILTDKGEEARRYLIKSFPCTRDRKWWKMWIGSWIPKWFLQRILQW